MMFDIMPLETYCLAVEAPFLGLAPGYGGANDESAPSLYFGVFGDLPCLPPSPQSISLSAYSHYAYEHLDTSFNVASNMCWYLQSSSFLHTTAIFLLNECLNYS